jgi:hypothetical protein
MKAATDSRYGHPPLPTVRSWPPEVCPYEQFGVPLQNLKR